MPIEAITDLEDPRLAEYRWVGNPDILVRHGRFVAEGHAVVRRLIEGSQFRARSILLTQTLWENFGATLDPRFIATTPIYVIDRSAMQQLTGIEFHRGCLAIGERANPRSVEEFFDVLPEKPICIAVLEDIINPDNMGGIFRNAQAFGLAAILLSPHCVDPLYRKAIRVSMGAALHVPFFRIENWNKVFSLLERHRFETIALTPSTQALPVQRLENFFDSHHADGGAFLRRFALFFGAEGTGLSDIVLSHAKIRVQIPIQQEVDSLNVATASGIAMHYCAQALCQGKFDAIS